MSHILALFGLVHQKYGDSLRFLYFPFVSFLLFFVLLSLKLFLVLFTSVLLLVLFSVLHPVLITPIHKPTIVLLHTHKFIVLYARRTYDGRIDMTGPPCFVILSFCVIYLVNNRIFLYPTSLVYQIYATRHQIMVYLFTFKIPK